MYNEGVAIVMPFFHCGSLEDVARRLNLEQVRLAVCQILSALRYLHGQGQIHRDITPRNILIRSEEPLDVVVADFGLASVANPLTVCGTEGYMAPEILRNREEQHPIPYTNAVDIYALGVLLLYSLGVELPPGPTLQEQNNIRHIGSHLEETLASCSDIQRRGAIFLASKMLSYNPENRPSAEKCLQHTWLDSWAYFPWIMLPTSLKDLPHFEPETRPENNPITLVALEAIFTRYLGDEAPRLEQLGYVKAHLSILTKAKGPVAKLTKEERIAAILAKVLRIQDPFEMPDSTAQSDRVFYCISSIYRQIHIFVFDLLAKDPIYKESKVFKHRALAYRTDLEKSRERSKSQAAEQKNEYRVKRRTASRSSENPQSEEPISIRAKLRPRPPLQTSDGMDICSLSNSTHGKSQASDRMQLCSE